MTMATTDALLARAEAAAQAAVALLPASTPLTAGAPTQRADAVVITGQAVRARFTGAAQGEVAFIVAQDLVDALADTPMGNLDLTQALRPALEAAVATLGPVVVDPGELMEPADAVQAIVQAGGALVPYTSEENIRAAIGLAVAAQVSSPPPAEEPSSSSGKGSRPGFDLLHDVEMEVTAELGRTRMSVKELLSLTPGAVIELDRAAGGPADLLVNGRLIARGEVVVIDENFGIRITEIVGPTDRS
jgi:flagellar motor switch protein FliN/FliY